MTEFNNRVAYAAEIQKLKKQDNPRIVITSNIINIDMWCDGNDQESTLVLNKTRRLLSLGNKLKI